MTKKNWLKLVIGSQAVLLALSVFGGGKKSQLQGPYHNFLAASTVEASSCGYCGQTWYGAETCESDDTAETECYFEWTWGEGWTCVEVTGLACC